MTWDKAQAGHFDIRHGKLQALKIIQGSGTAQAGRFAPGGEGQATLQVALVGSESPGGEEACIVRWIGEKGGSFSFLPIHLICHGIIQLPDFGVVIVAGAEKRAMDTPLPDQEPDPAPRGDQISWETWAERNNKPDAVGTVLGISRDNRFFVIEPEKNRFTATVDIFRERIVYALNRATTASDRCRRSLEDGCLPILRSRQEIGPLLMEDTWFVTFGDRPLNEAGIEGAPLWISHIFSSGGAASLSPEIRDSKRAEAEKWTPVGDMVVFLRTRITNRSAMPRFAAHKLPTVFSHSSRPPGEKGAERLDEKGILHTGGIPFSMHRVNGHIPDSLQPSMLLGAGESLTLESVLAHSLKGLSQETREAGIPWKEKFEEAKSFWTQKLGTIAGVSLPEDRLANFWKAGFCHLDLVTLGGRDESLLAKVGIYSAIGSESIPIIEFYDSIGRHDLAARCVNAFFDLQKEDGRVNLFAHYDIETGGALFAAGRHFAYTRNKEWALSKKDNLKRAADYLLGLRSLRDPEAPGHGLVAGASADPLEKTNSFMLNAYNVAGVQAVAGMLEAVGDADADHYQKQAADYHATYLKAFRKAFELGPVLPVARDRWAPTCAPWTGGIGLQMMGLQGEVCYTHRAYTAYDAILGPLYAVFTGIVPFTDKTADWLLEVQSAQLNRSALAESQPYYSRHPEVHLMRGERENFLNAFYSGLTSLADRETLSFWEHFHKVSIHKTHEEGWALMQLRRMLWLEIGEELRLFPGVPNRWFEKPITIQGAGSYFGPFSLRWEPAPKGILFYWEPGFHTPPKSVTLCLGNRTLPINSDRLSKADANIKIINPEEPLEMLLKA